MRLIPTILTATLAGALILWVVNTPPRDSSESVAPVASRPPPVEPAVDQGGSQLPRPGRIELEVAAPSTPDSTQGATQPQSPERRTLAGLVLDERSQEPVADMVLSLRRTFGRAAPVEVRTDDAGRFEIELAPDEYLVLHQPRVGHALPLEPHRFELPRGAGPFDLVLRTRRPALLLEVQVVDPSGRPAAGAFAAFYLRDPEQPYVDQRTRMDEHGRGRLPVWNPDAFAGGVLRAWDDAGHVSEVVRIDPPLTDLFQRLVLSDGGSAEILVRGASGGAVAGVRLALEHDFSEVPQAHGDAGPDGRALLSGLVPGTYAVRARVPGREYFVGRPEPLRVRAGERTRYEFVLEPQDVALAVSGRVLDEDGAPLAGVDLAVFPEPGWPSDIHTDERGEFRLARDGASTVRITPNLSSEGDVYEPAERVVPAGTRDVEFRRVDRARTVRFEVLVVDGRTGAELESFTATIDRGPGTEEWKNVYSPRRRFELRVLDATRWRIASHGYITRAVELSSALAVLEPGERLRVALEPGLDHDLLVLDMNTGAPIAGALLKSETAGEQRTDSEGRARVQAGQWSVYTVEAEGYDSEEWDPDDYVLWSFGPLYLAATKGKGEDE